MKALPVDASRERPSFLTADEVQALLRVNARTVYRLIRTGGLPAVRVGRQWRVRPADLDEWLERSRLQRA